MINFPTSNLIANVTTYAVGTTTYLWDGTRWRQQTLAVPTDLALGDDDSLQLTGNDGNIGTGVSLSGYQARIDGQFFVSTTAGRGMDPPVGEFGLYSDYNGTPVLEHSQPMNARGIRGVGNGYAVPGSTTGEILYDDWEVVTDSFGPGDHITTTGTGDNLIGLTKTGDNVATITLGDDAAARSAIGAQQQIDGVFLVSTAAQRALTPPVGELAFFANVSGVPTRENTQGLLVSGISGHGDPSYEFNDDNDTQLWFEVEFSGGGGNVAAFDTDTPYSTGDNFTFDNILYKINGNVTDATYDNAQDAIAASTQLLDGNLDRVEHVLDLDTVFSFIDGTSGGQYVGYVNSDLFASVTIASRTSNTGVWTLGTPPNTPAHSLMVGGNYVIAWGSSFAVGIALTTTTLDILRYHVHSGDDEPATNELATIVNLENVTRQSLPADNQADIEAVVQHNHEQDARIAALEHRDFTTTITSFDTEAALTNLFTSGTIVNKGNFDNNLYQAWTVTREGHELIGYLQLTDTERDSFRSEFSLTEGSSSNIYVPANPDEPHTVGIKAFAAADYNDLSENTQIILAQISSMRFGGNFGSETQFEIRWEILNYSDAIDTGLGTVDSGEIYGAAGDQRYAFYAQSLYTTPAWEFREATVGRTEIVGAGGAEFSGNGLSQATTPTNVIVGDNLTATPAVTTMETWPLDGFIIRDMGPVIIGSSANNSFPVVGPTSQDGLAVTMGAGGGSGGTSVARPITNNSGASIRMLNATITATISITCIDEFDMTFVVRNIDHTNSFSGTTTIPANSNNAEIEFTISGYGRTLLADESIEVYFNHNAGGVQNGTYTVTDLRFSLGSAEYGPETTMMDDFSMITLSASGGGAIPVTGSGQNIVGTTVVNGNLTGVALGTITGSSGPGEAPTAANVEPLFRDTAGDRSATFTQDSNEIVLTIGEDTTKVTTIRDVDGNALTKTNSEVTLPAFIQQTVNNTFSEPVVGSFIDDGGTARTISNIQHNAQGNLVVQSTGGQELTSELFTEIKARAALTNTATSLNAGTTLAGAEIATALSVTNLQTEANADARLAYFSGLGPFVGGTRGTATNAAFVKTGLNVPGSTATTAYYFISDKTWRATDSATGAILGIFGG